MAVIFSVNLYPSSALDGTVESQSFEFTAAVSPLETFVRLPNITNLKPNAKLLSCQATAPFLFV